MVDVASIFVCGFLHCLQRSVAMDMCVAEYLISFSASYIFHQNKMVILCVKLKIPVTEGVCVKFVLGNEFLFKDVQLFK